MNKGGLFLDPTLIPIKKTNKGLSVHHPEVSAALRVGSSPHQHANQHWGGAGGGDSHAFQGEAGINSNTIVQPAALR